MWNTVLIQQVNLLDDILILTHLTLSSYMGVSSGNGFTRVHVCFTESSCQDLVGLCVPQYTVTSELLPSATFSLDDACPLSSFGLWKNDVAKPFTFENMICKIYSGSLSNNRTITYQQKSKIRKE